MIDNIFFCLIRNELLGDLSFELDAVGAVLGHGFHPLKARQSRSIPSRDLSTVRGPLQSTPIWNYAEELGRIRSAQDSGFTLPLIIRCRGEPLMPNNIIWWVGAIVIVLVILGYFGFR